MKTSRERNPSSPLLINIANGNAASPSVLIVPKGEHPHQRGLQIIDDAALTRIVNDLHTRTHELVIDYSHGSIKSPGAETGKAAGWIIPHSATIGESGIVADIVWTDQARRYIKNGEYRYLSPVFEYDPATSKKARLTITRLVNAGLTNNPNIAAMQPISNQKEDRTMDFANEIRQALGLGEGASDEEVLRSLRALLESSDEQQETLNTLCEQLTVANSLDASRRIAELIRPTENQSRITELESELTTLREREGALLVENALSQGKITPAQKAWAHDYAKRDKEGFANYLVNAQAVPLKPAEKSARHQQGSGTLTADEQSMVEHFSSISIADYLAT